MASLLIYFLLLLTNLSSGFVHFNNKIIFKSSKPLYFKKYPLSHNHYERYIRRINSKNHTIQNYEIANGHLLNNEEEVIEDLVTRIMKQFNESQSNSTHGANKNRRFRIVLNKSMFQPMTNGLREAFGNHSQYDDEEQEDRKVKTECITGRGEGGAAVAALAVEEAATAATTSSSPPPPPPPSPPPPSQPPAALQFA